MNPEENSPWQYKPDKGHADSAPSQSENQAEPQPASNQSVKSVAWEAPEFIEQHHGPLWYAALGICTAMLAAIVYAVAHDIIATVIMIIVGVIVGVFAAQKPGQAKYEVNDQGLNINGKTYIYSDYKSFAVIREGDLSSVNLFPLKRFMPPLSAYFDPKDEKKISASLGNYLPYDERRLDNIERLTRRLRL
jgi:hypothetical protein